MASQMALQRAAQQQRMTANSQMCLVPSAMLRSSGQHCMSSPANILGGLDEFEGSFNMSLTRGMNGGVGMAGHAQQQVVSMVQQPMMQQQAAGLGWQQPPRPQPQMVQMTQSQPLPQLQPNQQQQMMVLPQSTAMQMQMREQQQVQQMPQQYGAGAGAGYKSIAVPVEAHEVQLIAQNLSFITARSGAQVTITSLPGAALAIMISGRPDQVAAAQSLLAAARSRA
jgi:hypothetical protein